jgi:kexin
VSFGPNDNGITYYNLHPMIWDVLSSNMRNALIHVHASGNGYQMLDTCAADGTISNPYVISVGAVDSGGNIAYYSEGCPSLTGVAPSSGSQNIVSALAGHSHTECTDFGGTSAAAPQVAGLVALLKSIKPAMTMRDARDVLIRTADREKLHAATFTCNAAGFCHSIRAGFGLFDGGAAVAYISAPTYKALPPQIQCAAEIFTNDALDGANVMVSGCAMTFVEYMFFEIAMDGTLASLRNVSWSTPAGTNSVFFRTSHRYTISNLAQSGGIFVYGEQPNGTWRIGWNVLKKNVVTRVKLILYGYK